MTFPDPNEGSTFSRRTLLKSLGFAPVLFRSAPLFGSSLLPRVSVPFTGSKKRVSLFRYPPRPALSRAVSFGRCIQACAARLGQLQDRKVRRSKSSLILQRWSQSLKASPHDHSALTDSVDASIQGISFIPHQSQSSRFLRSQCHQENIRPPISRPGATAFSRASTTGSGPLSKIETAEFEIFGIQEIRSTTARDPHRYSL